MSKKKHSARSSQQKFCLICEKPHRRKTKLCSVCDKKRKELDLSIRSALYLKDVLKKKHGDDFWEYVEAYPQTCYSILRYSSREERAERRRERTKLYGSQEYAARQYNHQRVNPPMYIQEIVKKLPSSIEFQEVQGNNRNPIIYLHCKECDRTFCMSYQELKKNHGSHHCECLMPSGEVEVKNYLISRGIRFSSQHDTLVCINPLTGFSLPYDFQIDDYRLIIEVQGQQHLKYIPYFHASEQDFEYQKYKDRVKKEFALKSGYKMLYIYYSEIVKGTYKEKIDDACEEEAIKFIE